MAAQHDWILERSSPNLPERLRSAEAYCKPARFPLRVRQPRQFLRWIAPPELANAERTQADAAEGGTAQAKDHDCHSVTAEQSRLARLAAERTCSP